MEKNCSCPGCNHLVPMGQKYCMEHAREAGYHRMPEVVHATVGITHMSSYKATVGSPEHGKNKI